VEDASRLYELMIGLGFDRVVTEVYGVVLTCGPLARRGIVSILPGLPGQVDDALAVLHRRGLIGSEYRRLRRRRFYAVAPHLAWRALGSELLWSTLDSTAARSPSPGVADPTIEGRSRACDEIAEVAGRLYRPHAAALAHQEWDAATEQEFARLICELIAQARTSVLAVSTSPRLPQVASFWATLTDRIGAGLSYRRIVDLDEVIDHGLTLVKRDIEEYGIDLRVLERDRIQHKFYVADRSLLAVFHDQSRASGSGGRSGVGRITSRGTIVRRYARRFREYASVAIPGRVVLQRMEQAAQELLRSAAQAKLTADEVAWVESLVQYGKFSRLHVSRGWSPEEVRRVGEHAAGMGLVRRNADGDLVPAYPVTERDIRAVYERSR
jgi:hypothetical protein